MIKRPHRSTLRALRRRGLPCAAHEMDWVYFCSEQSGRWRWGNLRTLWGVKTRQEIRAEDDEKEQLRDLPYQRQLDEDWDMEWRM